MKKRPVIRIVMMTLALGAVALVGVAIGGSTGGLHHPMAFAHGGPGMHLLINSLIDDLNLTDTQQAQLDAIHENVKNNIDKNMDSRRQHHDKLLNGIAAGNIDANEVKAMIDQHLEEAQGFAYVVADDLVTFINNLDDSQRATLVEKLARLHDLLEARHPSDNHGAHSTH